MKHIVLVANSFISLYNFRYELLHALLERYKVTLLTPMEESDYSLFAEYREKGCEVVETPFRRRGKNPFSDLALRKRYIRLLAEINPDLVMAYTIKPNIYAGMACHKLGIPFLANITGLGTAFEKEGILKSISVALYRRSLKGTNVVFFQNSQNREIFRSCGLRGKREVMLPGSGVNLERFPFTEFPEGEDAYLFMARIMKAKGADEFLYAASVLKEKYQALSFHVVGFCEEAYEERLKELEKKGIIRYHGFQQDTRPFLENATCIVQPSYHEGMSNVCLEAAAMGRPLLVSDIPGCRETVNDGETGFYVPVKEKEALLQRMEQFHFLSLEQKKEMGRKGREKMEREFDRRLVIQKYLEEIKRILEDD